MRKLAETKVIHSPLHRESIRWWGCICYNRGTGRLTQDFNHPPDSCSRLIRRGTKQVQDSFVRVRVTRTDVRLSGRSLCSRHPATKLTTVRANRGPKQSEHRSKVKFSHQQCSKGTRSSGSEDCGPCIQACAGMRLSSTCGHSIQPRSGSFSTTIWVR